MLAEPGQHLGGLTAGGHWHEWGARKHQNELRKTLTGCLAAAQYVPDDQDFICYESL
jgi:hypothetical protein